MKVVLELKAFGAMEKKCDVRNVCLGVKKELYETVLLQTVS